MSSLAVVAVLTKSHSDHTTVAWSRSFHFRSIARNSLSAEALRPRSITDRQVNKDRRLRWQRSPTLPSRPAKQRQVCRFYNTKKGRFHPSTTLGCPMVLRMCIAVCNQLTVDLIGCRAGANCAFSHPLDQDTPSHNPAGPVKNESKDTYTRAKNTPQPARPAAVRPVPKAEVEDPRASMTWNVSSKCPGRILIPDGLQFKTYIGWSDGRDYQDSREQGTDQFSASATAVPTATSADEARSKRQLHARQLEARFGRMPSFVRSSDGQSYVLPLESPRKSTWPQTLQLLPILTKPAMSRQRSLAYQEISRVLL
ncbi:hypothetical protein KC337_g4 [Hortaea werneckii]|nr:hypothetical protein KC337_g4 [Hortaea werneckii]